MSNTIAFRRSASGRLIVGLSAAILGQAHAQDVPADQPVLRHRGLHGYISSRAGDTPPEFRYGAGFYASVWSLIEEPIGGFQIGLPSTWIMPDNADNRTEPLCPPGTVARDHWPERGPTYSSVFQTMEGGIGYWAGNRFHYGPPKFSMNATPDCYSNEVASPGWPFFRSSEPLPDDRLGIAQISNRILIPPDGLPFAGDPMGELLGYAYMALPLTEARDDPQPTGNLSWTLFLDAANFKGPLAYYLPECWSRVSREFPFDHGRGLDARQASGGLSGAMEINTVPEFVASDDQGVVFAKIPQLRFPVDATGRTVLVRDVTMYSKAAIYDDVARWRAGGPAPTGAFHPDGAASPSIRTGPVTYRQDELLIKGINERATPTVFPGDVFGIQWSGPDAHAGGIARLPTYFRQDGDERIAINEADVPPKTGLTERAFAAPNPKPAPYSAQPLRGSWANPGPTAGPFETTLVDGSTVRYFWYRFIDQPVFQQFDWTEQERASLQAMIENMHRHWDIDRVYLPGPSAGKLVRFDSALFVTPPAGLELGYVPIVVWQGIDAP